MTGPVDQNAGEKKGIIICSSHRLVQPCQRISIVLSACKFASCKHDRTVAQALEPRLMLNFLWLTEEGCCLLGCMCKHHRKVLLHR